MLEINVDLDKWRATGFKTEKGTFKIIGECQNCGECCVQQDGDCPNLRRSGDKAYCGLEVKPWDCFLFPATRDPDNPLPLQCTLKILKVE